MATKTPLSNQGKLTDYIADRLANTSGAAEGSTLLPRQKGQGRIPIVTGFKVTQVSNYLGGSEFTLIWNNPQTSASIISGFNIYVTGALSNNQSPLLLAQVDASPANVRVVGSQAAILTFYCQTVLSSGATSSLDHSPTCTAQVTAPVIDTSDVRFVVSSLEPGGANQIVGTNPSGTASEWKTLTGTANQIAVALASGAIGLSFPTQLKFGAFAATISRPQANTTLANGIGIVFADCTLNSVTITMPPAPLDGQLLCIKRADVTSGNSCTLAANTGQTIETTSLAIQKAVVFLYDATFTRWRSIASF